MPDRVLHTYFGEVDRSLFGAFHVPSSGEARGAVVICPPLGKEQGDTTRGQKLLAERLTAAGIAALRFDYLHTQESWGAQTDRGAGDALVPSVRAAIEYVRASGAEQVALVGLRIGALLATGIDPDLLGELCAVALWEPVTRGSAYVRAERSLYQLAFDDSPEAGDLVHLTGASWHADSVAAIKAMSLDPSVLAKVGGPVAVATDDPDSAATAKLRDAGAEVLRIADQMSFIKPDSFYVQLPVRTVTALSSWLVRQFGDATHSCQPTIRSTATMSHPGDAVTVTTTVTESADGVVGWDTHPIGVPLAGTLITHATANDIRIGPARAWVEAAIELAPAGVRTLRHDRLGVGESGAVRADDDYEPIHSRDSVADALAMVERAEAGPIVHTGVCSGGWVAAAAASEAPATSRLVIVNQLMWRLRTAAFSREDLVRQGVPMPDDDPDSGRWHRLRTKLQPYISSMLPYWAWKLLGRAKLAQVPHMLLKDLAARDVDTTMVFSAMDYALFRRQRGGEALKVLGHRGWRPSVVITDHGDHAALHWQVRQAAKQACRDALDLR